jgi:hypothetical protein
VARPRLRPRVFVPCGGAQVPGAAPVLPQEQGQGRGCPLARPFPAPGHGVAPANRRGQSAAKAGAHRSPGSRPKKGSETNGASLSMLLPESMEMLGIIGELQLNGLHHSPTTQSRRSPAMRVKLQLAMCSKDGQEETVTEVLTLRKDDRRRQITGSSLASMQGACRALPFLRSPSVCLLLFTCTGAPRTLYQRQWQPGAICQPSCGPSQVGGQHDRQQR